MLISNAQRRKTFAGLTLGEVDLANEPALVERSLLGLHALHVDPVDLLDGETTLGEVVAHEGRGDRRKNHDE